MADENWIVRSTGVVSELYGAIDFKPVDIKLENSEAYLLQLGKNLS